jgi:hypothetical protein
VPLGLPFEIPVTDNGGVGDVPVPVPICPSSFRPQHTTSPAGRSAQLWYAPAATVLNFERKYAIAPLDAPSVTLQVGFIPLHEGPPHPANNELASGVAVNVIVVAWETFLTTQSERQENLGDVTLPLPGPPKDIERVVGTAGLILPEVGLSSFGGVPTRATRPGVVSPGLLSVPGSRLNRVVKCQEHDVVTVLSPGARKKFPVVFVIVVVTGGVGLTMSVLLGSAVIGGNAISLTAVKNELPPFFGVTLVPCGSVSPAVKRPMCRMLLIMSTRNSSCPPGSLLLVIQLFWELPVASDRPIFRIKQK